MSTFNSTPYCCNGSKTFKLADHPANDKHGLPDQKSERQAAQTLLEPELARLQEVLFAEHRHKILIVLQGMDTSGKDGTIRAVFRSMNPLGMRVQYFQAPTQEELDHDFLWRIHHVVPKKGEIVIFNRSHYEDVLVTRVKGWIDEAEEARRISHINDFERMLSDTGTTVLKFFLNISKEEQRERLQERIDNPDKNWKFNPGDLDDRKLWDNYQRQYEKVINATATKAAPWYIIPADSKSTRNLVIMNILRERLQALKPEYPSVDTSAWPKTVA